jgi:plastocyanin
MKRPRFRSRRIWATVIVVATLAFASGAFAATLGGIDSDRLTVFQSATTVPCIQDVNISNNVFTPQTVTITAGCSVRWTSTVNTLHSSTSNSDTGNTVDPWDSGTFKQSDPQNPFTRAFNVTGTFNYWCSIHKNTMTGTIVVN